MWGVRYLVAPFFIFHINETDMMKLKSEALVRLKLWSVKDQNLGFSHLHSIKVFFILLVLAI